MVDPKEGILREVLGRRHLPRERQDLSLHLWKCYQGLWARKMLHYFTISFLNHILFYLLLVSLHSYTLFQDVHLWTHPQRPSQLRIWEFGRETKIIKRDLVMHSLVPGKHDSHLEGRYIQVEPPHIVAESDL